MYLLVGTNVFSFGVPTISAQDFEVNANPGSWNEIEKVVEDGGGGSNENIPANLQEAMCGGWDLYFEVNGVFSKNRVAEGEPLCPPTEDEPLRAKCRDDGGQLWIKTDDNEWTKKDGNATQGDAAMEDSAPKTNPREGLIAEVLGVPGRRNMRAYGNVRSGLGLRNEDEGEVNDIANTRPRTLSNENSGFDYPTDPAQVCGLSTVCRPPSHPDKRQMDQLRFFFERDRPRFFCDHPCQRPLDYPGKPANYNPDNSESISCGRQEPYADQVKYACGGKQTIFGDGFCEELQQNGQSAGLCEDLNKWVYPLWYKKSNPDECIVARDDDGNPIYAPIFLFEKGICGFEKEVMDAENEGRRAPTWLKDENGNIIMEPNENGDLVPVPNPDAINGGEFNFEGIYECCSDDAVGTQQSCIPCAGHACRLNTNHNQVIINDAWVAVGGKDGPWPCNGVCEEFDEDNCPFLEQHKRRDEMREYISFFREYTNARYERAPMDNFNANDDHKKEHIPVACYGLYDMSPEDAKDNRTEAEDKRCVIAAYYPDEDDGDGDKVHFIDMKNTQMARGNFIERLSFETVRRAFDEKEDLWWPEMGGAFSLFNDLVFSTRYGGDYSFALLATDQAVQKATYQLDEERPMSSGSVMRMYDNTITGDFDATKERRTVVEWWHRVHTDMNLTLTLPSVRLLLPTTWTVDLNPLDPMFTPPVPIDEEERSPDIRSESIEVQVQASEDLLSTILSFMERNLLLRVESEPVPIVVPIVNPTELRAWAQGWEVWARKQKKDGLPGETEAKRVAKDLRDYADHADDVRKIRGELARYSGKMLFEQRKVSKKIAEWLKENIDAYDTYLFFDGGTQFMRSFWEFVQNRWNESQDNDSFPWCRNDRFTTPVYSLVDPWLPGRTNGGDLTGGFGEMMECLKDCGGRGKQGLIACGCIQQDEQFDDYMNCVSFVQEKRQEEGEGVFLDLRACDLFWPTAPAFPQPPELERDRDLVLDFTAFRETQRSVKLPVLKPVQVRIDFSQIRPPALEQDEEPDYPELADLPSFSEELSDEILDALPEVFLPTGGNVDEDGEPLQQDDDPIEGFREAAVLALNEDDPDDPFPKIEIPTVDLLSLGAFLYSAYYLVDDMADEYEKFWQSLVIEDVKKGTEQDCIRPYSDPKKKCVHFEADLKERFQEIGARLAIYLKDDFRAHGLFRDPSAHPQTYCEQEDWSCVLLRKLSRKPREGWMLDILEEDGEDNEDKMIREIRKKVRESTDNVIENDKNRFIYDMPQEEMFWNFWVPEGERIERRIERFEPDGESDNEQSSSSTQQNPRQ